jgi:cytochrome c oxidase cbb3-type subunit 3
MPTDRHETMTRTLVCRTAGALVLVAAWSGVARASEAATDVALVATGTLTAVFVLIVFVTVFILNGDIEPLVRLLRRVYAHIVPQETEQAPEMTDDFDGIRELDNRIPPWFNYLFGGTIIFAFIYLLNYHVFNSSPLPALEYQAEVAQADILRRLRVASEGEINEATLAMLTDAPSLASGHEKFTKYCITCHGPNGEGKVGPNLTDAYWLHGGGMKNVFATIKNGVPAKGMISWKLVFTPKEIQQIASFVLSLQGTNPPGGKSPEGTVSVEAASPKFDSGKAAVRP